MGRIEKTVFISYRRTNVPWALAIYQDLTMHGYDVFFDYQSIDSGNFEKVILENIKARAHFIVILTPSALERCKEPGDWLRREIETAMDEKRNIVPLMLESFDFGSPLVKEALTGKLAALSTYNGLRVYSEYFFEAMDKLRERYMNVETRETAALFLNAEATKITKTQKTAAREAPQVEKEQLTAQEWFERGYVFQGAKNLDEAFRCYSEAIRLDPNLDVAYNNLGNTLIGLKRYAEAEAAYRKAIELSEASPSGNNPSYATAYYNLGLLLHEHLKRYEEAEAAYRKAIELDPLYATAYSNLTMLLRLTNRVEEAMPLLEKLIEINPDDFNPYLALASINKQLGKGASPEYLAKARQLMPEDDWYNRACLESVCDNFDTAFDCLQKAAQRERFNPAWAWDDPDLQWIRDDPKFAKIVGPKPA
ncbi:MAG: tetratricopeptide repeat protein [Anaerolineales bacterium]|nr:tetratricopeptide repeat protein [Anaerolineales bacterium]